MIPTAITTLWHSKAAFSLLQKCSFARAGEQQAGVDRAKAGPRGLQGDCATRNKHHLKVRFIYITS